MVSAADRATVDTAGYERITSGVARATHELLDGGSGVPALAAQDADAIPSCLGAWPRQRSARAPPGPAVTGISTALTGLAVILTAQPPC
jgi:hypothetical protein